MRQTSRNNWPFYVVGAIGLATIPIAARVISARRRAPAPDNAPGFTARRSLGEFTVVGRSVTIARPRAELFAFWRDFANLPQFMENLEKVEPVGSDTDRCIWSIRGPAGRVFAVETTIAREIENELIAWRSTPESEVTTEGRVTFHDAPGTRGTRVSLIVAYQPPGGAAGKLFAKLARRSPELQARHDLKRFKMLIETGEIATSGRTKAENNSSGSANQREKEMA